MNNRYDEMGIKEDETPGDKECTVVGHIELPPEEPKQQKKKEYKIRGFNRPVIMVGDVKCTNIKEFNMATGKNPKKKNKNKKRNKK